MLIPQLIFNGKSMSASVFGIFILCLIINLNACKDNNVQPLEKNDVGNSINSISSLPYVAPPRINLPIDFTRKLCGVTIFIIATLV
jgi:hypothetical protein